MPHAHNDGHTIIIDDINNEMRFMGMHPHRGRDLATFTRDLRVSPDQIKNIAQLLMIALCLRHSKYARAFNIETDDIIFGQAGETERQDVTLRCAVSSYLSR